MHSPIAFSVVNLESASRKFQRLLCARGFRQVAASSARFVKIGRGSRPLCKFKPIHFHIDKVVDPPRGAYRFLRRRA